jgi:hypothetical protein
MSTFAATPVVLAHQGGWDEALLIGGPILVIVGLLMLAKRRVDAAHHDPGAGSSTGTG